MSLRFYTFLFLLYALLTSEFAFGQPSSGGRQIISINQGSAVVLRASSVGGDTFMWFKDGVLIEDFNRQTLVASTDGIYRVASLNPSGCTSNLSDEIQVVTLARLKADVEITKRSETRLVMAGEVFQYYIDVRNHGDDDASQVQVKDVLPDNLIFEGLTPPLDGSATYDANSRTIQWNIASLVNQQFSELVIQVRAKQAGTVLNTAIVKSTTFDPVAENNTATDQKVITGIKIPNVFTPNADGKNDYFTLVNLEKYDENEVTIVNRWGSTVYQSNGYLNDWTAQGLSDGTYFYVVKVKNANSEWLDYKGYITVIR